MSRNAETFAAVDAALARGEAVCIFPEGISHSIGQARTAAHRRGADGAVGRGGGRCRPARRGRHQSRSQDGVSIASDDRLRSTDCGRGVRSARRRHAGRPRVDSRHHRTHALAPRRGRADAGCRTGRAAASAAAIRATDRRPRRVARSPQADRGRPSAPETGTAGRGTKKRSCSCGGTTIASAASAWPTPLSTGSSPNGRRGALLCASCRWPSCSCRSGGRQCLSLPSRTA